jgi:hypothetical protein
VAAKDVVHDVKDENDPKEEQHEVQGGDENIEEGIT